MTELTYLRYEVLRTWRNRRFLIFSLVFPLILFLAIAGPHRHVTLSIDVSVPPVLHDRHDRLGHDGRGHLERRAHRGRAQRRLDATTAHHARCRRGRTSAPRSSAAT